MTPFYKEVCAEFSWPLDNVLVDTMSKANKEKMEALDGKLEDAKKNLGETEVRDVWLEKGEYLCVIGDKEGALSALRESFDKTISLGQRLDVVFNNIRLGFFYGDNDLVTRNIEKAWSLVEEGGDWDRRNRLKVYEGLYKMTQRDFKGASALFLDTVSTFTCYELCSYDLFIHYAVISSVISLGRVQLKDKCVNSPEVLQVLHGEPRLQSFLNSFYGCKYDSFFRALAEVEGILSRDRYLAPHTQFYVREMRILAYSQLLESYRSLTLESMAASFGVSVEYMDAELSRFIAAGRLNCKIDKVGGIVETNRPDSKNAQYQAVIKEGDILLTRIQKLSRVINV